MDTITIEDMDKAIASAKQALVWLEYGDDHCHSNGRYEEQTTYIRYLEGIKKKMLDKSQA